VTVGPFDEFLEDTVQVFLDQQADRVVGVDGVTAAACHGFVVRGVLEDVDVGASLGPG